MSVPSKDVKDFFAMLNKESIRYVLIKNLANELPDNLPEGKDIDILVNIDDKRRFNGVMSKGGYKRVAHPWRKDELLYQLEPFEMFIKNKMYVDACFQLCCRSITYTQWLPLDQIIQASVWNNRVYDEKNGWYILAEDDMFVYLLSRCIFDKRKFTQPYNEKLSELYKNIDREKIMYKLKPVFFNFSEELLKKIAQQKFDEIVESYRRFDNY